MDKIIDFLKDERLLEIAHLSGEDMNFLGYSTNPTVLVFTNKKFIIPYKDNDGSTLTFRSVDGYNNTDEVKDMDVSKIEMMEFNGEEVLTIDFTKGSDVVRCHFTVRDQLGKSDIKLINGLDSEDVSI